MRNARGSQLVAGSAARRGLTNRGGIVVFDNYLNPGSAAGLNVSYEAAGSYDGSNPSTDAIVLPMAERLTNRAPLNQDLGYLIPTDIVWNGYEADAASWPGGAGGGAARLMSVSLVPSNRNTDPPPGGSAPVPRVDTLRVRFFSSDRAEELGGFDLTYMTPVNYVGYFGEVLDVSMLNPPIMIPRTGYVMLDWAEGNVAGVGSMYAGGDFVAPGYPSPESLWRVGETNTMEMWWADGVIGSGGWPNRVDDGYDGDPSSTSYLDIFNTGLLANWGLTIGDPPTRAICHDFPCRLVVEGGVACPCDVNGSGGLNSQDFFDFITAFFLGSADFNHSGFTDSQDFFDFLVCFFGGC
ncbi:MAG: hypothetical protein AB7G11_10400 [Phycisphaerales bacterium]